MPELIKTYGGRGHLNSNSDDVAGSSSFTSLQAVAISRMSIEAKLTTRSNLAVHHLRAAVKAAREAFEVERANAEAEHGQWFSDLLMSVPISVAMSGAALEANANEIVQDILGGLTQMTVTPACKLLLEELRDNRSGNSIDKYWRLALLLEKLPLKSDVVWQDITLLVKLRNALLHFKPAWDDEEDVHDGKLARALRRKVGTHPAYTAVFQFPHGLMTYSCARWCVMSVVRFATAFSNLLGVSDRFAAPNLDLSLPEEGSPLTSPE